MNLLSSLKISNIPKQANFLKIAQKPLFTKVTEGRYWESSKSNCLLSYGVLQMLSPNRSNALNSLWGKAINLNYPLTNVDPENFTKGHWSHGLKAPRRAARRQTPKPRHLSETPVGELRLQLTNRWISSCSVALCFWDTKSNLAEKQLSREFTALSHRYKLFLCPGNLLYKRF